MRISTAVWPVCITATAFFSFGWLTFAEGAGALGEPTVLVYPPGWSKSQVLSAIVSLNTPIVELGPAHFVAVVVFETPEAVARVYNTGAIVMLNAAAAALCGIASSSHS